MKKVVFIILDKFANWELAYLSAALGEKQLGTEQYSVLYASTDKEVKTSIGNLKALPDLSIWEIPEDISALVFIGAEGSWHNLSKEQTAQLVTLAEKVKSNGKVLGLSKMNRIVEYYAKRPQVQERLTMQIVQEMQRALGTEDVACIIDAKHLCVNSRGIEDIESSTVTAEFGGKFKDPEVRKEFLEYIKLETKFH